MQDFFLKDTLLTKPHLLEGLHHALGMLEDIVIDYPNACIYMQEVLSSFRAIGVLEKGQFDLYN